MERIVAMRCGAVNSKKHAGFQLATIKSTRWLSVQFHLPAARQRRY